jgi:hypothetical protein
MLAESKDYFLIVCFMCVGSKYEKYRILKRERFNARNRAKREMEKLKKTYQKERNLEKRLQVEYLRLKVELKAMKLSQIMRTSSTE